MNKKDLNMPVLLFQILGELKEIKKILKKDDNADNKQTTKKAKEPKGGKDSEQGDKASSLQSDGVAETQDSVSSSPSAL